VSLYAFEIARGLRIKDEEEFRRKVCGTCRWQDACEEWELLVMEELGKRVTMYGWVDGVFRCALFSWKRGAIV